MAHKRSKSEWLGQVPFGFDLAADGKALVPNPLELEALDRVRRLAGRGVDLADRSPPS